ncbi:MAG: ATP-binding protein [Candidatus Latescibacterota bacterium]|jgi:two-component system phosphate regulon sensor histidine kinase PhoR
MLRSRFLWKLYIGYAVIILLMTVILGVFTGRQVERNTLDQVEQSLHAQAVLLRDLAIPFVDSPIDSSFQKRVWFLGARTSTRYTVIRADGVVVADSKEDPLVMDNHGRRPEVMAAMAKGEGVATRYSRTVGEDMMYLALPIHDRGNVIGFVRASIPLTAVKMQLAQTSAVVILVAVGAAALALLIGFYVARRVTRPISRMTEVAKGIAAGNYEQKIHTQRVDEIGSLATALNTMTERLRDQFQTISNDRNKMAAILSGMVEGVIAIDPQECIVHINDAAERILCVPGDECMGRRIWEATRVLEVSEALNGAMKNKHVTIGEARIAAPQQEQVVQLIATPLWDANDALAGALVVLHDVSEIRQLETVRRDFIANISHELKTPLAAIRGLIETLIDDKKMDGETHDRFLGKIQTQSSRLTTLVTDLLTISRLESDDATKEFHELDLREPLSESLRNLRAVAESKRLTLDHSMPDEPVNIIGDMEALRELFDNLAGNAIKYTPSGGNVHVTLRKDQGWAVLDVEDDGIGISPGDQSRVFERFYRVDKARSRELGGTGLGLSIVKHVALSHGGNVSLRSALGEGSSFRVQIPLSAKRQNIAS